MNKLIAGVILAGALTGLSGCNAAKARGQYNSGRSLANGLRAISNVKIVHGTDPAKNHVAFQVDEGSALKYQVAFGGTEGGLDPSLGAEINLTEGWAYIQGNFNAAAWWRVPIMVTHTVAIGAYGTAFLVRKGALITDEQTVACSEGKVEVSDRINFGKPTFTVTAGNFIVVKWDGAKIVKLREGTIASDGTIRDLVASGKAFADGVK